MKVIRGIEQFPLMTKGSVVTIGNFDGVHRGHQLIIQQLVKEAKSRNLSSVVMLFEPQPLEFFIPDHAPIRLDSFRDKIEMLTHLNVDYLLVIRFNETVANLSREDFLMQYLLLRINTKYLIVGDDFRFGKNRSGDFHYLKSMSKGYDFVVEETPTLRLADFTHQDEHERRVSSSWVREALLDDDFKMAEQLLGRPYSLSGHVAHGDKRGRKLGYPTMNIHLKHDLSLITGIYVVDVLGLSVKPKQAVASIGRRPTFGGERMILEVYVLDFDQMVYGKYVSVRFYHKLRDELKFNRVEDLVKQMDQDVLQTREFFHKM